MSELIETYSLKDIFRENLSKNKFLAEYQQKSWEQFEKTGLPSRKDEKWKHTNLRSLSNKKWTSSNISCSQEDLQKIDKKLEGEKEPFLVLLNGTLVLEASSKDIKKHLTIRSLEELSSQDELQPYSHLASEKNDPILSLTEAMASKSFLAKVTTRQSKKPIRIYNFISKKTTEPQVCFSRFIFDFQKNTEANIQFLSLDLDEKKPTELEGDITTWASVLLELRVCEGANINFSTFQDTAYNCFHILTKRVEIKSNATLSCLNLSTGAKVSRQTSYVDITGNNSQADIDGLYLTNRQQHTDHYLNIDHQVPYSQSSQNYKGLLNDASKAIFQGSIHVAENAQKTSAHQLNKNLLLTKTAGAITKPNLTIEADDVKCTHGATVSPLREDEVFYLQSRGITRKKAKNLLCQSFAKDVLQNHTYPGSILETKSYVSSWDKWFEHLEKGEKAI